MNHCENCGNLNCSIPESRISGCKRVHIVLQANLCVSVCVSVCLTVCAVLCLQVKPWSRGTCWGKFAGLLIQINKTLSTLSRCGGFFFYCAATFLAGRNSRQQSRFKTFICVKLLCFLHSWHRSAPRSPCSWASPARDPSRPVYTVQQMPRRRTVLAWI